MSADSPDLVIAKRLLDHLKLRGFQFQRTAPGADGPLVGSRVVGHWRDTIHIEGFSRDCSAWRKRTSSLIAPGEGLVEHRMHGSALNVLNEVLTWKRERDSQAREGLAGGMRPDAVARRGSMTPPAAMGGG